MQTSPLGEVVIVLVGHYDLLPSLLGPVFSLFGEV